ncbi:MAG: hypothetical protein M1503_00205 [Thaumarchaeota archaeon]|nr:hypothetical protein [Nitrososphaerota archaeon]MCL5316673.1 hypothetical protein [Nitrososphaerota archaeon]
MSFRYRRDLTVQTVILLLFLFLFFVVLDIASTQWLIQNTPGGIINELNPLAVMLYGRLGLVGMVLAKLMIYTSFSVLVMYFTLRFSKVKQFVEVSQMLVLCQMAVSIIVVFNNFVAILATLFVKGDWPLVSLPSWLILTSIFLGDIALGAIFANGILYIWGATSRTLHLKVLAGLAIFVAPVVLFAEGFRIYVWLYVIYVASAALAIGLMFYLSETEDLSLTI